MTIVFVAGRGKARAKVCCCLRIQKHPKPGAEDQARSLSVSLCRSHGLPFRSVSERGPSVGVAGVVHGDEQKNDGDNTQIGKSTTTIISEMFALLIFIVIYYSQFQKAVKIHSCKNLLKLNF